MFKFSFLLARLHYYYQLLLRRTLVRSVPFAAIIATLFSLTILISCNDNSVSSPFSEILSQPAYASLTDSIKQQPKNDELYFRRAVLLNKDNLPEPALADFKKAWTLSSQEKYAFGITNIWLAKNPDSAIHFLTEALKELSKSYLLRLSLARAYDSQNKTEEALSACNDILQNFPDQTDALVLQSELFQKKGDTRNSIISLEKACSLAPSDMKLAFDLAYKYAEDKNPRALSFCDSLISRDSLKLFAEPYYIKGIYYSNISDKSNAIRYFNETIKRDYNNLNAHIEKGKIFFEQKKTAEAFKVFQLVNTIKPAFPDAYYWMGRCLEAMGQKEEALSNYEKAYALDKTFTEAKEAADKLK